MDYKIAIDLTYISEVFRASLPENFLLILELLLPFMDCYKIYIYWDNIRRYHFIAWEK